MADDLDRIIWQGFWQSSGRGPTDGDSAYWRGKWPELNARGRELNQPGYAYEKLLGRGAGGVDVPQFGPFAQPPTAVHDVPPFPGDVVAPPAPTAPDPTPAPTPVSPDGLAENTAALVANTAALVALRAAVASVRSPALADALRAIGQIVQHVTGS